MAKTVINYRKRIAKELHSERANLKQLKQWKCYSDEEVEDNLRYIAISESKIELMTQFLKK